jgi:hypothetical protein
MADLFTVTAPLAVRLRNGDKRVMLRCFPYGDGLIYLAPFWNRLPADRAFQVLPGPLKGDGPWKAGDAVITVLGCHGTDAELAAEYAAWQSWLQQEATGYPDDEAIEMLARAWIDNRE